MFIINIYFDVVVGEKVGDGVGPFDNRNSVRVIDGFSEIFRHEAWVTEAVEVVMSKGLAIGAGVRF